MVMMNDDDKTTIVIVGGGIIGLSIAYFLCKDKQQQQQIIIILLERKTLFCGSSGLAAGLLAKEWDDRDGFTALTALSFDLHAEIAAKMNDPTNYRHLQALSMSVREKTVNNSSKIGDVNNTAQCHPLKLLHFLRNECELSNIVEIRENSEVVDLVFHHDMVSAVVLSDNSMIQCHKCILAMGSWTNNASMWFKKQWSSSNIIPKIIPEPAFGILLEPQDKAHELNEAKFVDYSFNDKSKAYIHMEIYPRPDNDVVISGAVDDDVPYSNEIQFIDGVYDRYDIKKKTVNALTHIASNIEPTLRKATVKHGQIAFLPYASHALPVMGKLNTMKNTYICTGHSCWGILNSLASGLCMSEVILYGRIKSIDNNANDIFSPGRKDLKYN